MCLGRSDRTDGCFYPTHANYINVLSTAAGPKSNHSLPPELCPSTKPHSPPGGHPSSRWHLLEGCGLRWNSNHSFMNTAVMFPNSTLYVRHPEHNVAGTAVVMVMRCKNITASLFSRCFCNAQQNRCKDCRRDTKFLMS